MVGKDDFKEPQKPAHNAVVHIGIRNVLSTTNQNR
jgi:hypothetical protein